MPGTEAESAREEEMVIAIETLVFTKSHCSFLYHLKVWNSWQEGHPLGGRTLQRPDHLQG